jgi:hypothetical protein
MEQHQQPDVPAYVEMVSKLNQAIFYCYNESSERLPVNIIRNFNFKNEKIVCFAINYFPLTEKIWDVFAAELHFYKKGMPFSVVLHGIAVVSDLKTNLVEFNIQNAEYFEQGDIADNHFLSYLFKPYLDFYRKSSELFSATFSKKPLANALHK